VHNTPLCCAVTAVPAQSRHSSRLVYVAHDSSAQTQRAPIFLERFKSLVPAYLDEQWTPQEGFRSSELAAALADSELEPHIHLPQALEEFYLALGRCEEIMEAYHFFFDPEELVVEEGHLLFLEDEDERWAWGVDVDTLDVPDPLIRRRSNAHERWTDENATVSEFIFDLLEFSFEEEA
jgi:hypothetical protein